MREAACVAGRAGSAAGACRRWRPATVQRYARTLLVDITRRPVARAALAQAGRGAPLQLPVRRLAGVPARVSSSAVGSRRAADRRPSRPTRARPAWARASAIVAFSAICAHKLMYPTPQISFIGLRSGVRRRAGAGDPLLRRQLALRPGAGRARDRAARRRSRWLPCCWSGRPRATGCTPWASRGGEMFARFLREVRLQARNRVGRASARALDRRHGGGATGRGLQPPVAELPRVARSACDECRQPGGERRL